MKKEFTHFEHGFYGLDGYERYSLQSNAVDTGYLLWNKTMQRQIENELFEWNGIFKVEPYLKFPKTSNTGYAFPSLDIVTNRNLELFHDQRFERYASFIVNTGYDKLTKAEHFQAIHAALSLIHTQLERQTEQLELIDKKLMQAFKVFYYECEQVINKESDSAVRRKLINELYHDLKHLYQVGIRRVSLTDILLEKWIPKRIGKTFVPEKIGKSLRNAISHLVPQKEPILKAIVPIFEKYIHLETAKFRLLNDKPLLKESDVVPVSENVVIESAIKQAIYGLVHSHEAEIFIREYAAIHAETPYVKSAHAIEEIREKHPDIKVDNRTLYTWITKYEDAL